MRWIKRLTRTKPDLDTANFDAPVQPGAPFCAVGDIHGRMDLLVAALDRINAQAPDLPVVFVGDYVDRGPDSAAVLRHLYELQDAAPDRFICLAGNHEDFLLGFLDDPFRHHRLWSKNGGDATLQSFGVRISVDAPSADEVENIRDQLQQAMGADLLAWLRELPTTWRVGNVWVTHAGGDPTVDLDRQDRSALLWGHPDFRKIARRDNQWVVHGHTIVPEVEIRDGRVAIDTGAYRTEHLSVVRITDGNIDVLC
ncbi:serine/threonine protein phosphatase [Aliiroseovarius sp. S1339]|uniref:metallophosphoesterase family protein n=1 Tax=Aliiroseovarius sp. S1339 TaxID=2936990 RepID=UPI0020BD9747|nr:metallophosphoesterase family protein [Aliiroseovarius sp. S1339]MCK8462877.1 serine/threonine protein phosphatase [Aliiroseovarius sp. S1339]